LFANRTHPLCTAPPVMQGRGSTSFSFDSFPWISLANYACQMLSIFRFDWGHLVIIIPPMITRQPANKIGRQPAGLGGNN